MSGEPVKLYVYDLSNGLARQMSMPMTGRQIDGIWHTAVVLYGHEFYYGQGILSSPPGTTHLGPPLEVIDMGETYLPEEVVIEYIESQRSVFTPEKYHLLDFNCNTFSNSLCQFLTGGNIPQHISDLPADFLNTPLGQSIRPMIEGMFGQSQLAPPQQQQPFTNGSAPTAAQQNMLRDISSAALSAAPQPTSNQPSPLQTAPNLSTLQQWIQSYKAVVVFFTSATCPPCRMIKPDFERLVQEKNEGGSTKIKLMGVTVDTSVAFDAAQNFGIRATPTFMLFHNGNKFSEFRGASFAELTSSVNLLLFTAYPPHPHRKIHQLRGVLDLPNKPVLYNTPGKVDMIYSKLNAFLEQDGIKLSEQDQNVLDQSKIVVLDPTFTVDMAQWSSFIDAMLEKLPLDHQFPLLDIFRTLFATKAASEFYMNDCSQLVRIIENGYKQENVPKATLLMTLRVACNLFAHSTLVTTYFTSTLPTAAESRASLTQLLVSSLLSADSQVRQTAASLAFNCSTVIADERLKKEKEDGYLEGMAEQEDDDWQIEITSAIMDDLSKESDEEVIHRLLAAIAKFLFLAPTESSSVADLLSALEIKDTLETKKDGKIITASKVTTLAKEVLLLIDASASA
ncbi:PPPDE putative peptidase domain-containing protein [Phascolomyces articulosus]|uniref:PPPDE putative peptidase domain-containing protein n=1 Tax=Phascolomyces articulosus TaxID=60185 RepID=A0AAD5K3Q6_9FUNG|nr:PPPDE putative peptidase domain-containing protein [Phascolomyces articulosus]